MHQDWKLFGSTLESVVQTYKNDVSEDEILHLQLDIKDIIADCGNNIETDFVIMFPNSVIPSGWDMTVEQWLLYICDILN